MKVFEPRDLMIAGTTAKVADADGNLFNVFAGTTVPPHLMEAYIAETGQEPETEQSKVQTEPEKSTLQTKPERHTAQEAPETEKQNPITRAAAKKAAARRKPSH